MEFVKFVVFLFASQGLGYDAWLMASKLKGYLKETRRPIYSAAMVLPFLCVYHAGTFFLNTTTINGADALMIRLLGLFSVHSMLTSAAVLAMCFIIWQVRTRASWTVKSGFLLLAFLESLCFALVLLFGAGWLFTLLSMAPSGALKSIADLVLYCGAGVYEELVFRAFLLGFLIWALGRLFNMNQTAAAATAAVLGALIFSAFHYIGPAGDAFSFGGFMQRALGGLYFSAIYVTRGFGITAASHAIYDIILGSILR